MLFVLMTNYKNIVFFYWLNQFYLMLLIHNQDKLYKILYFFNFCAKTLNTI